MNRSPHRYSESARSVRVILLLWVVTAMSLIDLMLTMHHMTAHGMYEANPVVLRLLAFAPSVWTIVAFKALTLGLSLAVQLRFRAAVTGELGAVLSTGIMIGVMVMWARYPDLSHTNDRVHQEMALDDGWVWFGAPPAETAVYQAESHELVASTMDVPMETSTACVGLRLTAQCLK